MSKLDDFIFATDLLVKFHASSKEVPETSHSITTLEARISELKDLWKNVKENYAQCARYVPTLEEEPFDIDAIESKYRNSNKTYVNCLGLFLEFQNKLKPEPVVVKEFTTVTQKSGSSHCIKLPPCDTDVFHGDYISWPAFRDMFDAVYIQHPKLGEVEKLFHLRCKTRDEAFRTVSQFPLTNASFALAWAALRATYENTRILVNNQVKNIFNLPTVHEESAKSIRTLQSKINDSLAALKAHQVDTTNWDPILVFACCNRLPKTTLSLWEQSLEDPTKVPTWNKLDKFLNSRFQTLESISDTTSSKPISQNFQVTKKNNFQKPSKVNTFLAKAGGTKCKICSAEHTIYECPKFSALPIQSRIEIVREKKMCNNCLGTSHQKATCSSKYSCRFCKKRHHTLLHLANNPTPVKNQNLNLQSTSQPQAVQNSQISASSQPFIPQATYQNFMVTSRKRILLATALVSIVGLETVHIVRALIDPGSEVSFISAAVQKRLNLPYIDRNTNISGISGNLSISSKKLCSFSITSANSPQVTISAKAIVLKTLTNNLPSSSFSVVDPTIFEGLPLADPTFNKSSQVDLLIGADLYPSIIRNGIKHISNSLLAQNTMFGWILSGPIPESFQSFNITVTKSCNCNNEVRRFWELEELPFTIIRSKEDCFCEELYKTTTFRRADGRFVVRLPFKPQTSKTGLGHSRFITLKQFSRTEKSLASKENLKSQYSKVISEYLSLNHMRKVTPLERIEEGQVKSFYLPHHAVIKPESTSTKVRVVFNASNASSNGVSLNDLLYPGPILQQDLSSLIIRWRFYKYVFNADIEKMYRQILVNPRDTPFQRILFRTSPHLEIEDYELLTVTFGVNCAPYLAIRTLLELSKIGKTDFPLASKILQSEFYVDDVLSGGHNIHSAKKAQSELISLLDSAGFPLRKWTSNTPCLLEHLPREHILNENFLKLDTDSNTKTLGIRWNAKGDNFYFSIQPIVLPETPTKREVFSQICRIFDPAGWLAPVVIVAKMLMQRVWAEHTDWDDLLESDSFKIWKNFAESLNDIKQIEIPRWVNYSPSSEVQFHGFCDSSEKAYAATLYISVRQSNGTFSSHLLCAKSRVSPIKSVSLPRLELCGALLLSKMVKIYVSSFPVHAYQTFLWTDSSIVLAWLKKPPCVWKTFIANRTSEILENVGNITWRHVKSAENPADLATRGLMASDLMRNTFWWNGPSWLCQPLSLWPVISPIEPLAEDLEEKPVVSLIVQERSEDILDRFSSLPRAMRVICYIFRFYFKLSKRNTKKYTSKCITPQEMQFVQNRLILQAQRNYYSTEHSLLMEGRPILQKSSLISFNPFLDSNHLIRVNGRLSQSDLSYNERHPLILPHSSRYSFLLTQFIHEISLHGGNSLMLRLIRQAFWIPKLKDLIRFCIRNCKICVIQKKVLSQQLMAALPPERCTFSPPFTFTGIDFAGPFVIKTFNARNCRMSKGYACVFVCFSTKAIHLEAVSDLSSEAFLAAFARFVARRGLPKEIYSEHGTNFAGADVILRKEFKKFISSIPQETQSTYGVQGLKWNFIPPGAPHMGGLWEAGVKSCKSHLRKLGTSSKLTFEEFSTVLARIEACLNSRPISSMSNDSSDLLALTPGHFLRGSPLLAFPEYNLADANLSLINRWEKVKCLQQQFCRRWKDEYLKELHQRHKWQSPQEDIKLNDLVVVKNENLPSTEWRLGRVVNVHPGPDGRVRVATLRTQLGEISRPVVKLCLLPMK
ncbi:uncharacterized protein LOC129912000 [Episyrphus balteatus]|uniref:uncharacterized protein LOC129912000 n=1 Tax=Episyrphus balteatus TaxID=286459 RepID=UPI002485C1A9|nr:uncharacterized protein LOC129912000 [Episyrphus balteatus]